MKCRHRQGHGGPSARCPAAIGRVCRQPGKYGAPTHQSPRSIATQLQEQITARNQELHTLNTIAELITRSLNLDILPRVLRQTLKLIPARGAAVYLLRKIPPAWNSSIRKMPTTSRRDAARPRSVSGCQGRDATDLQSSLLQALGGRMNFFACAGRQNCLNVPLICRHKVLGVMTFVQVDFNEISPEMQELLNSVGRQIGITIESLQNVEKLVHSKDLHSRLRRHYLLSWCSWTGTSASRWSTRPISGITGSPWQRYPGPALGASPPAHGHFPHSTRSLETVFSRKNADDRRAPGHCRAEIFRVHYYPIVDDRGEVVSIVAMPKILRWKSAWSSAFNMPRDWPPWGCCPGAWPTKSTIP